MYKFILISLFFSLPPFVGLAQNIYKAENAYTRFFSEATIEDITASNNKVTSFLDLQSGEIVFSVPIQEFEFDKSLMKEHFNENYMEVSKGKNYSISTFKGKITNFNTLNLEKDGVQEVLIKGELMIHNVSKTYQVKGSLARKGSEIKGEAKFKVRLEDHEVEIPSIMFQNIAEEVEVTVLATYKPFKK